MLHCPDCQYHEADPETGQAAGWELCHSCQFLEDEAERMDAEATTDYIDIARAFAQCELIHGDRRA